MADKNTLETADQGKEPTKLNQDGPMPRRELLVRIGPLASVFSAFVAGFMAGSKISDDRKATVNQLLAELFGVSRDQNHPIVICPAFHHPDWAGKPHFSESGEEVGIAYEHRFRPLGANVQVSRKPLHLRPEDGMVVIGARFANIDAKRYLGSADTPLERKNRFLIKPFHGKYQTTATWLFHTPEDVTTSTVNIPNLKHTARDHHLVSSSWDVLKSRYRTVGNRTEREDDYLLVTVLPRGDRAHPQRTIILEGLHRSGTRIATELFTNPPMAELQKLRRKTIGPYYQAVFRAAVYTDNDQLRPRAPELIDAVTLPI